MRHRTAAKNPQNADFIQIFTNAGTKSSYQHLVNDWEDSTWKSGNLSQHICKNGIT